MAIGWTLAIYFARRFAIMVLGIFLFFSILVGTITYLEFTTRSMSANAFDPIQVLLLTAYKVPGIAEELLPFVTLFGSISAFVVANRRLEVVVARAAGLLRAQLVLRVMPAPRELLLVAAGSAQSSLLLAAAGPVRRSVEQAEL